MTYQPSIQTELLKENINDLHRAGLLTFSVNVDNLKKILLFCEKDKSTHSDLQKSFLLLNFKMGVKFPELPELKEESFKSLSELYHKALAVQKLNRSVTSTCYSSTAILAIIDIPNLLQWVCTKTSIFNSTELLNTYLKSLAHQGKLYTKLGQEQLFETIEKLSSTARNHAAELLTTQSDIIAQDERLRTYYLDFQQFLHQSYLTAMVLSSGEIQFGTNERGTLLNFMMSTVSTVMGAIPGVSIALNGLSVATNYVLDERKKNRLKVINNLYRHCLPVGIEKVSQIVAREVTLAKKQTILEKGKEIKKPSTFSSLIQKITSEKEASVISQMAIQDVTELLNNFVQHQETKPLPDYYGEKFAYQLIQMFLPTFKARMNAEQPSSSVPEKHSLVPPSPSSNEISDIRSFCQTLSAQLTSALTRIAQLESTLKTVPLNNQASWVSNAETPTHVLLAEGSQLT